MNYALKSFEWFSWLDCVGFQVKVPTDCDVFFV